MKKDLIFAGLFLVAFIVAFAHKLIVKKINKIDKLVSKIEIPLAKRIIEKAGIICSLQNGEKTVFDLGLI